MGTFALVFVGCWVILHVAPETSVGALLHRLLVVAPAARLSRITRGDVAVAIVLAIGAAMIAFVGEGDGVRLLTLAAPDLAIWITTFEVSAYVDVIIAVAVAATNLSVRISLRGIFGAVRRPRRRAARTRSVPAPGGANDDDHRWAAAA